MFGTTRGDLVINTYTSSTKLPSAIHQPEVVNTIQQLPIANRVILKAVELFHDIRGRATTKSVKGTRKRKCVFYCVFMAYRDLGHPMDVDLCADMAGLEPKHIDQAFNEFSPPGALTIDPESYVGYYIRLFNTILVDMSLDVDALAKMVRHVITVCRQTTAGNEWIGNNTSKTVVNAAIYFALSDVLGVSISGHVRMFEDASRLSWACICRYHDTIRHYYNADETRAPSYVDRVPLCINHC